MTLRFTSSFSRLVFSCIGLLLATGAQAGIGGPFGEYYLTYQGPETLTLMVVPDGSGNPLNQAAPPFGGTADATITLILRDAMNDPVPGYPREDLWLESEDNGLVRCQGGSIADADTDANGMTRWESPLRGGGQSEALTVVKVNGSPIEMTSGVRLSFNSPDLNGDLVVNLSDVALFAADYFQHPVFSFRADLYRDGVVNLADLAVFSRAYGTICP